MKRAVAGVGQSRIMRMYSELFETVGLKIAQLLVSQRDFIGAAALGRDPGHHSSLPRCGRSSHHQRASWLGTYVELSGSSQSHKGFCPVLLTELPPAAHPT